jgi:hypothetical protein
MNYYPHLSGSFAVSFEFTNHYLLGYNTSDMVKIDKQGYFLGMVSFPNQISPTKMTKDHDGNFITAFSISGLTSLSQDSGGFVVSKFSPSHVLL